MTHPRIFARTSPDKPAVIIAETGELCTYRELDEAADRGARVLRAAGVATGDCIAIWLRNVVNYLEIFWAGQRAGVYVTPIPVHLTPVEAAYILRDSGSRVLISASDIPGLAELCSELRDSLPLLETIATIDTPTIAGCLSWEALCEAQPAVPIADEAAGLPMVYSSGTTGNPKGVRRPLVKGDVAAPDLVSRRLQSLYTLGEDTVYLSPAPLYHAAPLNFCIAMQRLGATVVLLTKFDPEAALRAIGEYRVTFTQLVPTMMQRFLRLPEAVRSAADLSSLRCLVHAAAPCPVEVKRATIEWLGPIVYEYYGSSESVGATFINSHEWLRKPGSVGRASMGILHITTDEGEELGPNQDGLVYFESPNTFDYLNAPEKTAETRHPNHADWFTMGDIGRIDEDGYLYLSDRRNFMIISGGVNVYPQEIENLLSTHPKVADVAVLGVPDPDFGEAVKAVVQPLDADSAGPNLAAELISFCRANLSPVKCPRSIDFDPALPRDENGKIYKRRIRDRYWPLPASASPSSTSSLSETLSSSP